jgi:hypothetical protein
MKKLLIPILIMTAVISLALANRAQERGLINTKGTTVLTRFIPPKGYRRVHSAQGTFAQYLRNLPLKTHGSLVSYYNGSFKTKKGVYIAVVDFDIDRVDLQQCADAVMRLRAEYLYAAGAYDRIGFTFVNGFHARYAEWMSGKRIAASGNRTRWEKTKSPANDYHTFRDYLLTVFNYASTISLKRDTMPVRDIKSAEIGDILIQPGSPGHAIIIIDMAYNEKTKTKAILLAQSYMPAQDIQVLINPEDDAMSPWYEIPDKGDIETPEWIFTVKDLRRFEE